MPLLTVVLLTYNHEKTIARAFDSILEQKTSFDFDIFVLEDCSTDRTREICMEYKIRFPDKITLFLNEKNLGVAENLKNGLLKIKAKYYASLEGDDYWCDSNKLQKQIDALEANTDCTICGHNTLFRDDSKNKEHLNIAGPKYEIKTKYTIKDRFGAHFSSRVYRNIIDLTDLPSYMVLDLPSYLLYLTKGNLFYIDEVMSVYNFTDTGFWAGRSRRGRRLFELDLKYKVNKYFNFAYDYKFYPRVKYLKVLKKLLGIERGWELFYRLEKIRLQLAFLGRR